MPWTGRGARCTPDQLVENAQDSRRPKNATQLNGWDRARCSRVIDSGIKTTRGQSRSLSREHRFAVGKLRFGRAEPLVQRGELGRVLALLPRQRELRNQQRTCSASLALWAWWSDSRAGPCSDDCREEADVGETGVWPIEDGRRAD